MKFSIYRVMQAAVVSAILETTAAAIRSHSFYLLPFVMYAVVELVFFFVVISISAFVATRIPRAATWAQRVVFFLLVVAPSIFFYYNFYRSVSSYSLGGRVLVINHQITAAGIGHFSISALVSGLITLIATLIYFRKNSDANT